MNNPHKTVIEFLTRKDIGKLADDIMSGAAGEEIEDAAHAIVVQGSPACHDVRRLCALLVIKFLDGTYRDLMGAWCWLSKHDTDTLTGLRRELAPRIRPFRERYHKSLLKEVS